MTTIHAFFVTLHILVGAIALPLFWMPLLTRKGSRLHIQSGRVYAIAMYVVSLSGLIASLMVLADPLAIRRPDQLLDPAVASELALRFRFHSTFLLMLSVLVLVSIRHGLAAVRERHQPGALTHPVHVASVLLLAGLGVIVGALGITLGQMLLMIFAGISLLVASGMIREIRMARQGVGNWLVAHLGGLIGSGIGAYTAFFAFGGRQFFAELLPGQWQMVPWVLPSIIGALAINRLSRRYRDRVSAG